MASIVIAGDTSGSVTLQAPAVAGSTVLNLPSTSGTIQTSGAGYTTNGVAYATSTSALSTGSALTFDGTNLGLGTSSPTQALSVYRGTSVAAFIDLAGNANTAGTSSVVIGQNSDDGGYFWNRKSSFLSFGTNNTEQMRLTSTGLGIGTSSPATKLDIGANDSTAKTITLRYSSVPSYYSNTYDGSVGLNTLSLNSYNTSSGSSSWSAFSNTSYGSAAIQLAAGTGVANSIRFLVSTAQNTAPTEFMRLDSAGNLGLGVTPSAWDSTFKNIQIGGNGFSGSFYSQANGDISNGIVLNAYFSSGWKYTASSKAATQYEQNNGIHKWSVASSGTAGNAITFTQAMTLDSSGNLLVNTTGLDGRFRIQESGLVWARVTNHGYAGTQFFDSFRYNGTEIGKIQGNNSNVSYLTSSDYRLKENIAPMTGALATVAQLKPCTYTWKVDGASGQGFIAHELQEVVPDCVSGEKDAVNEDGSIKPQGIDTSFLVATLTAALQEAHELIKSLETRISVLENK